MTGALERAIRDEIREWSKEALESKNPYFNDLPACPYAKKVWADQQVKVVFKHCANTQPLFDEVCGFNDGYELIIVVDLAYPEDPVKFHEWLEHINDAISNDVFGDRDLWVMGFHPNDDANDLVDDGSFEPLVEVEYAMIFIQRLSRVMDASEKLKKQGYYDKYFEEYNVEELFERRSALYRRLQHGDATT